MLLSFPLYISLIPTILIFNLSKILQLLLIPQTYCYYSHLIPHWFVLCRLYCDLCTMLHVSTDTIHFCPSIYPPFTTPFNRRQAHPFHISSKTKIKVSTKITSNIPPTLIFVLSNFQFNFHHSPPYSSFSYSYYPIHSNIHSISSFQTSDYISPVIIINHCRYSKSLYICMSSSQVYTFFMSSYSSLYILHVAISLLSNY